MAYDPNEPRDKDGKWAGGASSGRKILRINFPKINQDNGNKDLARKIADQHTYEDAYRKEHGINPLPNGISVEEYNKRIEAAKDWEVEKLKQDSRHSGKSDGELRKIAEKRHAPDPRQIKTLMDPVFGATYRAVWSPYTKEGTAKVIAKSQTDSARYDLQQDLRKAAIASGKSKKEALKFSHKTVFSKSTAPKQYKKLFRDDI